MVEVLWQPSDVKQMDNVQATQHDMSVVWRCHIRGHGRRTPDQETCQIEASA
jgi:hypothetical protein